MSGILENKLNIGWFIYKYRTYIIGLIVSVGFLAVLYLPNIQFKSDFSKFFPEGNSDIIIYKKYASIFGDRDDYLSIGISQSNGVFNREFLTKVQSFTDSCKSLEQVRRTFSILNLSEVRHTPFGILYSPLLDLSRDSISRADRIRAMNHPLAKGQLLSDDSTAILILIELAIQGERATPASEAFIDRLNELLTDHAFEEAHIIGTLNLEVNHIRLTSQELLFFIKVCIVLIVIILLFIYRSWIAMLLPLLIFLLSMVFLGALLALLGITLDTMSTMLPTILLIVSISDVIHIFTKIRSTEGSTLEALIDSIERVAWTNLLTSVTTAFGFFTLIFSPMPTLVDFGISVGLGVLIAYVLSVLIVPITFFFLPGKIPEPKGIFARARWEIMAVKLLFPILNRPVAVYLGVLVLILLSLIGVSTINYDRFLTSTMPFNHEIRKSYQFFEDKFNGSREFDIAITTRNKGGLMKLENLVLIDRLQRYLDSLEVVGGVQSSNAYFKFANNLFYAQNKDEFSLPNSQERLNQLDRRVPKNIKHAFRSVIDSTMTYGAIRGNMRDVGMLRHLSLMKEIDQWISRQVNSDQLEFRHTGIPLLLDKVNRLQIRANLVGLLIATAFISLLIALLFRRWLFVLVTLTGNFLPLLMIAGVMGFTNIQLRGGTSLIFSVVFVIIVDDTIHFLSNFLQKVRSGQGVLPAIQNTLRYTGQAIFLTTLVLAVVTLALLWSDLPDVRYLGFLMSLALFIALIFDLVLIPTLLKSLFHSKGSSGDS